MSGPRSLAASIVTATDRPVSWRQELVRRVATPSAEISCRISRTVGRDTRRDQEIRTTLHAQGLRFRVHQAEVPGTRRTIDIAFSGHAWPSFSMAASGTDARSTQRSERRAAIVGSRRSRPTQPAIVTHRVRSEMRLDCRPYVRPIPLDEAVRMIRTQLAVV